MLWFQMAFGVCLLIALIWDLGIISGILIMCSQGSAQQSMEFDPTKNGTITVYVFILIFQFALAGSACIGFGLCFKVWRNQFQLDKKLRHYFILWFSTWITCLLGVLGIGIYAIVRGKDPQGQIGFMYEMFQKNSQQQQFIASFERYQREHNCCGLYGPDDWLMIQLQHQPGASAMQSMDFGMQMNPSTGKCHLIPPSIPIGCGRNLLFQVNQTVTMYAALSMVQLILGIATGILAWYCFFHWLEEDVMILPTDELCEIIVIEPPEGGGGNDDDDNADDAESRATYGQGSRHPSNSYQTRLIHMYTDEYGNRRQVRSGSRYMDSGSRFERGRSRVNRRSSSTSRRRVYMTRSQVESEVSDSNENSRVSARRTEKSMVSGLGSSRNRRGNDDEESETDSNVPPPRKSRISRTQPKKTGNARKSRASVARGKNRNSRRDSPPAPADDSESVQSESSSPSRSSSRQSRPRTSTSRAASRPRTTPARAPSRPRPSQSGRRGNNTPRRPGSRSRTGRKPVEAKILYKNRKSLDGDDSD